MLNKILSALIVVTTLSVGTIINTYAQTVTPSATVTTMPTSSVTITMIPTMTEAPTPTPTATFTPQTQPDNTNTTTSVGDDVEVEDDDLEDWILPIIVGIIIFILLMALFGRRRPAGTV